MKQTEILTHATHVNGRFPAVYMSCMSQNFRLFHVSNLSVRNFPIFLLMYTGSIGLVRDYSPVAGSRALSEVSCCARCVIYGRVVSVTGATDCGHGV